MGQIVLCREDVAAIVLELVAPEHSAVAHVYEVRGQSDAVPRAPYRPLEHGGYVESPSSSGRVKTADRCSERGAARGHLQTWRAAERGRELICESIREILLRGVAAEVRERKHRQCSGRRGGRRRPC